jgi:hypothetical protein
MAFARYPIKQRDGRGVIPLGELEQTNPLGESPATHSPKLVAIQFGCESDLIFTGDEEGNDLHLAVALQAMATQQ